MNYKNILQETLLTDPLSYPTESFGQQEQPIKDPHPFQALDNMLIESPELTKFNKARQLLGEKAKNISDEQLETFSAQFDYLINTWLDLYEKQLFDGKTLREISEV